MKLKNLERVSNCKNKERLACFKEQSKPRNPLGPSSSHKFHHQAETWTPAKEDAGGTLGRLGKLSEHFPWPRFCQGLSLLFSLLTVLRISTFDAQLLCNLNI